MRDYFTKLDHGIIHSSLWDESDEVRVIWVTLLAMCDTKGVVRSSVGGIANAARKQRGAVEKAIALFMSPDPDSKCKDHEGRRVLAVEGGFLLINHARYRMDPATERRRERDRLRQKRHREEAGGQEPAAPAPSEAPEAAPAPSAQRFTPPTLDEVKLACAKAGLPEIEAEKFVNHYTSVGWIVGKKRMSNWPAALAGWRNRWQERQQPALRGTSTPSDKGF